MFSRSSRVERTHCKELAATLVAFNGVEIASRSSLLCPFFFFFKLGYTPTLLLFAFCHSIPPKFRGPDCFCYFVKISTLRTSNEQRHEHLAGVMHSRCPCRPSRTSTSGRDGTSDCRNSYSREHESSPLSCSPEMRHAMDTAATPRSSFYDTLFSIQTDGTSNSH
ncbi:hypothetical protein MPH_00618 [Macrophomina phaseolina MS6]|uniref:Uncharacterized protein n=1 Tax=Macrophomina phaseolina (strain MS6) TaxID=1126212 RepID=K2SAV2_MACPH|nr:hypothetical protein MPH_00618 [Macrophomina phaseolina MS6]